MSQGAQAKFFVESGEGPYTYDSGSEPYVITSDNIREASEIIDAEGIRGTRSRHAMRHVEARTTVGGTVGMTLTHQWCQAWLPRILGGTTAGGVTNLAETLPSFGILSRRVAADFSFEGCKVNRATITGSAGQLVTCELDILGKTADDTPTISGSLPDYPQMDESFRPIVFSMGTLTAAGQEREFTAFTLTIDNLINAAFYNSPDALYLDEQDRTVELSTTLRWEANNKTSFWSLSHDGTTGSMSFLSHTGQTITWSFGQMIAPRETPVIPGKTEIPYVLNWRLVENANQKEIRQTISA